MPAMQCGEICTMLSTAAALGAMVRQQCFAKLLSMSHVIRPCRHTAALAGYASVDMHMHMLI